MWQDGPNGEVARRPPKPPSVNLPSGTAHLLYELDKVLLFWLRDGRTFIGVLKSLDQFGNVVVSGTIERIYVGTEYGDIERGICKLALMSLVDWLIEQFYCLFSTVNDIDWLIDWLSNFLSVITIDRLIDWLIRCVILIWNLCGRYSSWRKSRARWRMGQREGAAIGYKKTRYPVHSNAADGRRREKA